MLNYLRNSVYATASVTYCSYSKWNDKKKKKMPVWLIHRKAWRLWESVNNAAFRPNLYHGYVTWRNTALKRRQDQSERTQQTVSTNYKCITLKYVWITSKNANEKVILNPKITTTLSQKSHVVGRSEKDPPPKKNKKTKRPVWLKHRRVRRTVRVLIQQCCIWTNFISWFRSEL